MKFEKRTDKKLDKKKVDENLTIKSVGNSYCYSFTDKKGKKVDIFFTNNRLGGIYVVESNGEKHKIELD